MKQPYLETFIPPAPGLHIILLAPESSLTVGPFDALIDTGTDVSSAPLEILEQIQAPLSRSSFVRPHWGTRQPVSIFFADVQIGNWKFPGIEFIADPQTNEILIGRNLLNKLWLLLAGPERTTEISPAAPRARKRR